MATVALYAVGAAVGSALSGGAAAPIFLGLSGAALGGVVGGAVGGIIDSQFIYPAVFGRGNSNLSAQKLDDLLMQTASEGSGINFVLGTENKMAGTVIYLSDLIAKKKKQESGGKGGGGPSSTTYTYTCHTAIGVCEGPVEAIEKIWADDKLIYNGADTSAYESLSIHLGGANQTTDTLLESLLGASNVPAYRGLCYVVIESLKLAKYGNRMPRFTFKVRRTETTYRDAARTILKRAGLVEGVDFDVSGTSGAYFRGYVVQGPQQTAKALEPLMFASDSTVQEVDGMLVLVSRASSTTHRINPDDLGATDGQDAKAMLVVTDADVRGLPTEMSVSYIDITFDFQRGVATERRFDVERADQGNVDVPISLHPYEAQQMARRKLWASWAAAQTLELELPPAYLGINEGDLILLDFHGAEYNARVQRLETGANFVIKIEAVVEDPELYVQQGTFSTLPPIVFDPYHPGETQLFVLDCGPLREEDAVKRGLYHGFCNTVSTAKWLGGETFWSPNNSSFASFDEVGPETDGGVLNESLFGYLFPGTWDRANSVELELYEGELSSVSELDCLNGANRLAVGAEVVGFVNAALIAPRTYRISQLLRGLRNTEDAAAAGHIPGTPVCVLSPDSGIRFQTYNATSVGRSRWFRGVPTDGVVGGYPSTTLTLRGGTSRPFPPCDFHGERDDAGNLVISWKRRSRVPGSVFGPLASPTLNEPEKYQIEILVGGSVVRTLTTTTTSVSYSASQQTSDDVTIGAPVAFRVYMINDLAGRSKMAVGSV